MNADRTMLTDKMQQRIEPLFPGKATDPGVTAADNRLFVEAVLWRIRTGAPWRDLPPRFGKQHSVYRRFRRQPLSGCKTFNCSCRRSLPCPLVEKVSELTVHQAASQGQHGISPGF